MSCLYDAFRRIMFAVGLAIAACSIGFTKADAEPIFQPDEYRTRFSVRGGGIETTELERPIIHPDWLVGVVTFQGGPNIDFSHLRNSGIDFIKIRISNGIWPHREQRYWISWHNASFWGYRPIGFHALEYTDGEPGRQGNQRYLQHHLGLRTDLDRATARSKLEASGAYQARYFISRLMEVAELSRGNRRQIPPIMLDASVNLFAGRDRGQQDSVREADIRDIYQSTLCGWIRYVRNHSFSANSNIIIHTSPFIFEKAEMAEFQCIKDAPDRIYFSVRQYFREGKDLGEENLVGSYEDDARLTRKMCPAVSDEFQSSRCLFHQYTARYAGNSIRQNSEDESLLGERFRGSTGRLADLFWTHGEQ